MTLVRLDAAFARLGEVANFAATQRVVYSCADANTIMCSASLRGDLQEPLGVWLDVGPDYPAQMAARDVKTLSWIIHLDQVVISAVHDAEQHADVVRALLTNDEVNFTNDVASLSGAYNRPAPPRPLTVWSWDGTELRVNEELLRCQSSEVVDLGTMSTFA